MGGKARDVHLDDMTGILSFPEQEEEPWWRVQRREKQCYSRLSLPSTKISLFVPSGLSYNQIHYCLKQMDFQNNRHMPEIVKKSSGPGFRDK